MSVSSDGVEVEQDFNNSMLRTPKIIFTPGSELRATKKTLEFQKIIPEVVEKESGGEKPDDL